VHALRPYQQDAVAGVRRSYRQGARRILVVCPTGGGKTRIGVEIARSALSRSSEGVVYWIAPRRELVRQAYAGLVRDGVPETQIGILGSGYRFHRDARVQVATIQTLVAMRRRGVVLPKALLVVPDEARHLEADEWGAAVQELACNAPMIGLEATPERPDGRPLGDTFDDMVVVSSVTELQYLGVLVPAKIISPETAGRNLAADPVDAYLKHAAGKVGFIFCPSVADAESTAEKLRQAEVPAAVVCDKTKARAREAIIAGLTTQSPTLYASLGGVGAPPKVVCNVRTMTEGVDVQRAEFVMLACRSNHPSDYLQKSGRAARACESTGKTHYLLIDLTGNCAPPAAGHGLPDADREYSLSGQAIRLKNKPAEDTVAHCKECGLVVERWAIGPDNRRMCPGCGALGREMKPLVVDERPLTELGRLASFEAKVEAYRRFVADAERQGHSLDEITPLQVKPRRPSMRFRELFGALPLPSVVNAALGLLSVAE
jgi:DNA repair protein RadD